MLTLITLVCVFRLEFPRERIVILTENQTRHTAMRQCERYYGKKPTVAYFEPYNGKD